MNLKQRIVNQLEHLASKGPQAVEAVVQLPPQRGYIVGLPSEGEGMAVSLGLEDYDRYSVTLRHLEVVDNSSRVIDDQVKEEYLRQVAAEVCRRLSYLEEPLALIELEPAGGVAQLRSDPPQHSLEEAIYWEVRVQVAPHPTARLTRYRWTATNYERRPLPHPVTFATAGRISEDLTRSLTHME